VMGFNKYDKFMLGAAAYNHFLPGKHFEWTLMPMYSFGDQSLVGHADAFFHFYPSTAFQEIRFGANMSSYHFYTLQASDYGNTAVSTDRRFRYTKIAPELVFDLKKRTPRSPVRQSVKLRAIWLKENYLAYNYDSTSNSATYTIGNHEKTFYELSYQLNNSTPLHPWDMNVLLQGTENMLKAQVTGNYHITLKEKRSIDIRLFGGYFIQNENAGPYRFRMSGWGPMGIGNQDYLYDYAFFGRSENGGNLASQQMVMEDGGFKIYSPNGQSDKWLGAVNINLPSPFKNKLLRHIKAYGDFGIEATTGQSGAEFMYDAGLQVSIFRSGICDIYFPLVFSKNIKDYYSANGLKYGDMIRFTFNLKPLNPFVIARNIQI
jgi:hypothetical protein